MKNSIEKDHEYIACDDKVYQCTGIIQIDRFINIDI